MMSFLQIKPTAGINIIIGNLEVASTHLPEQGNGGEAEQEAFHSGAWCKPWRMVLVQGHQVTALDLTGCGADPTRPEEIHSIHDYVRPLMEKLESLPPHEKVVLVGHSFGGLCLSLAMEKFPDRVALAIFATAFMPDLANPPSRLLLENLERLRVEWSTDIRYDKGPMKPPSTEFLASIMYQCSPPEDATLAATLMRPSFMFVEDLSNDDMLSMENYGSVNRAYIICKEDSVLKEDFQRWIIQNNPPKEVKEIDGADHMAMMSKPQELCQCLLEIAEKYA
ncbi:hypothetical protein ACLOJK_003012 [Asimina triloba]